MKTLEQVAAIEATQRATEAAFEAVFQYLRSTESPTSEEAHAIIDRILDEAGCESPEGHIVAGGVHSAEPHEKGAGILNKDEPIVIDIYPRSKTTGYFADMTRTVCLGTPSAELVGMYEAVQEAQELAISLIRPGVRCMDIQQAVENYFIQKGFETSGVGTEFRFKEGFVHGVGHGVGLEVHELPHIGRKSDDTVTLEEGEVITVEPGLYYVHIGGVRLEDMVVVTAEGCRNLTKLPKQLVIL